MERASIGVIGGSGAQLEIYTAKGLAATQIIAADDLSLSFDLPVEAALYVRAQLRDPQSQYVLALTNPIYVETEQP